MSAAQHEFNELMRDKAHRTQHPHDDGDDDGARSFLNLSDDSEDEGRTPPASATDDPAPRHSTTAARNNIPHTRYAANTGPKGVIADAQNFRDSRRKHRNSIRGGSAVPAPEPPTEKTFGELEEEDEDDGIDDEEDHDFMRKWRQSRFKELQSGGRESKMQSRERNRWVWGGLTTVDGNGYLDALDNSPSDTVVVVYIFDDYSQVSSSIEDCIRTLAQKHPDVRFIKLHFEDAEMEPAGVPAVLAYRGGDKFADLIPVIQEIPDDAELSASTLEVVMKRHQILT